MKIKNLIFELDNLSLEEVLEYLTKKAGEGDKKTFVVTLNPEIVMLARRDSEYEAILKSADLALIDGVGLIWAGKMFGKSFKGRVHGSDLVEKLCKAVAEKPITVGFLGGERNVAIEASNRLKEKYPGLKITFALEEWPQVSKSVSADILFVAFGSPKQEKWIAQNLSKIDVKVAIGVGGAFDFISGRVRRSPKVLRNLGLEWLFRLIIQPWRAKRQVKLPEFVALVVKEKFLG